MSSVIQSVAGAGIQERRAVMSNSSAAAYLEDLTDWTELWLGCRLCINDNANDIVDGIPFIGVLAAPDATLSNGPLTMNTSHFIGQWAGGYRPFTMLRRTAYLSKPCPVHYQGVASVGDRLASGEENAFFGDVAYFSANPAIRYPMLVRMIKNYSESDWLVDILYNQMPCPADCPRSLLRYAMTQASDLVEAADIINSALGGSYVESHYELFPVNTGVGDPDALCFGWNKEDPAAEFSEVLYVRKS